MIEAEVSVEDQRLLAEAVEVTAPRVEESCTRRPDNPLHLTHRAAEEDQVELVEPIRSEPVEEESVFVGLDPIREEGRVVVEPAPPGISAVEVVMPVKPIPAATVEIPTVERAKKGLLYDDEEKVEMSATVKVQPAPVFTRGESAMDLPTFPKPSTDLPVIKPQKFKKLYEDEEEEVKLKVQPAPKHTSASGESAMDLPTFPKPSTDLPVITPQKFKKLYEDDDEEEVEVELVSKVKSTAPPELSESSSSSCTSDTEPDEIQPAPEPEKPTDTTEEEEEEEKKELNLLPIFHLVCSLVSLLTLLTPSCGLHAAISALATLYFSLTTAFDWRLSLPTFLSPDLLISLYLYLLFPATITTGATDLLLRGQATGAAVLLVPVLLEGWILYKIPEN